MKVLIATGIYSPDVGGPATYSALLEKELPKRGVEVKIITYGKLKNYPWILRQPAYFFRIFLAARNVDIIYAQDILNSGISSYVAASIWRKKFLLKIVGDYAWEQGAQRFGVKEVLDEFLDRQYGFMVECFRFLEKFVAGRADKIIVPSEYLRDLIRQWGVLKHRAVVIRNAAPIPRQLPGRGERGVAGGGGRGVVLHHLGHRGCDRTGRRGRCGGVGGHVRVGCRADADQAYQSRRQTDRAGIPGKRCRDLHLHEQEHPDRRTLKRGKGVKSDQCRHG